MPRVGTDHATYFWGSPIFNHRSMTQVDGNPGAPFFRNPEKALQLLFKNTILFVSARRISQRLQKDEIPSRLGDI